MSDKYIKRTIDTELLAWKNDEKRKVRIFFWTTTFLWQTKER